MHFWVLDGYILDFRSCGTPPPKSMLLQRTPVLHLTVGFVVIYIHKLEYTISHVHVYISWSVVLQLFLTGIINEVQTYIIICQFA